MLEQDLQEQARKCGLRWLCQLKYILDTSHREEQCVFKACGTQRHVHYDIVNIMLLIIKLMQENHA